MNFPLPVGDQLGDALRVCSFITARDQRAIVESQGLNSFHTFLSLSPSSTTTIAETLMQFPQGHGGLRMTAIQRDNLQTFIWWLHDMNDRGFNIAQLTFTVANLTDAKQRRDVQEQRKERKPKRPEQFSATNWISWWEKVKSYLHLCQGSRRRSLAYVIRDEIPPAVFIDDEQEHMYQVTLTGAKYSDDNHEVFELLNTLTLNTEAHPYIQRFAVTRDGRQAALALKRQYEGVGATRRRYEEASAELKRLYYKGNEAVYPFDRFASNLIRLYNTINLYHPRPPKEQVETMAAAMHVSHDTVLTVILMNAITQYPEDLPSCLNQISSQIAAYKSQPVQNPTTGRTRTIS